MKIITLTGTMMQTNNYILTDGNNTILIECSITTDKLKEVLSGKLYAILLTHSHWDHFLYIEQIAKETGATVFLSQPAYENILTNERESRLDRRIPINFDGINFSIVKHGDILKFGNIRIEIIETPGHSNCSLTFSVKNYLFTGDTLFNNAIGRTDTSRSNESQMKKSLKYLLTYDENMIVLPGHGESTTVKQEKNNLSGFIN